MLKAILFSFAFIIVCFLGFLLENDQYLPGEKSEAERKSAYLNLVQEHITSKVTESGSQAVLGKLTVNSLGEDQSQVLIPLSGSDRIVLIDRNAQLRHDWPIDAQRARLLPDNQLLVVHGSKFRYKHFPWTKLKKLVALYDSSSVPLWSHPTEHFFNADVQRLKNGNFVFLERVWAKDLAAQVNIPERKASGICYDKITEMNPQNQVVWEWSAAEQIDLNDCGHQSCDEILEQQKKLLRNFTDEQQASRRYCDWTHINTVSIIPANKWFDQGDRRFRPGNLLIMLRNFRQLAIIDHQTKQIVYTYSGNFKGGIGEAHDPKMIPKNSPGAGNILIFDNGVRLDKYLGSSYVLEINPITEQIIWSYEHPGKFASRRSGAVQRRPNGNTFISEDRTGRVFEVDRQGEVVWEFYAGEPVSRATVYEPAPDGLEAS